MLTANNLAPVEVDKTEARRLQEPTRHLVLLAGHRHTNEFGLLSLPLRASATGVQRDIRRFGTAMIRPYSW